MSFISKSRKKRYKISLLWLVLLFMLGTTGCEKSDILLESLEEETMESVEMNESEVAADVAETAKEEIEVLYYIHVCGAVQNPGVYRIPENSRYFDAIEAAGGFTDEAANDYLNLAAVLQDGMRLEVPTTEQIAEDDVWQETSIQSVQQAGKDSATININIADQAELCSITGIGESRAEDIITYRTEHGNFKTCEDIMQVTGIKEGLFNKIKDKICVQ